ncbi:MAG: hypothetical protein M3279_04470 [Actinomycetota bacterium]|nr:hypothetical protein [Actinomycetota bacterium]
MLRKAIVLTAAISVLAAPVAGARGVAPQEESGTVVLPAPSPNGGEGCWQGFARRFWIVSSGSTGGPMGSVFDVDESTWNGKFKLEVTGGAAGSEDLDVHFFMNTGSLDPTDPAMQNVAQSSSYQTAAAGGEKGTVPEAATAAIICLRPGTGANAGWTYVATPPKKKK